MLIIVSADCGIVRRNANLDKVLLDRLWSDNDCHQWNPIFVCTDINPNTSRILTLTLTLILTQQNQR